MCGKCVVADEIVRDEGRAAGNVVTAGWTALGCGALALFGPISPIGVITYLFGAMSVFGAVFALQGIARSGNERFAKHLTSRQQVMTVMTSIVGMVLTLGGLIGVAQWFVR